MKLANLKATWHNLNDDEKLNIIEASWERRAEAFEIRSQKKVRKTSSPKKRKASSKKTPTTPEGLAELMESMTPEERENFMLSLLTNQAQ